MTDQVFICWIIWFRIKLCYLFNNLVKKESMDQSSNQNSSYFYITQQHLYIPALRLLSYDFIRCVCLTPRDYLSSMTAFCTQKRLPIWLIRSFVSALFNPLCLSICHFAFALYTKGGLHSKFSLLLWWAYTTTPRMTNTTDVYVTRTFTKEFLSFR